jgi:L-alanine-DL-glutamate epimerase-like enolase superfamily enzyme
VKITATRPADVAREVEAFVREGHRSFVISSLDHGGMLDLERLGAARYAAGLQSKVELEASAPTALAIAR